MAMTLAPLLFGFALFLNSLLLFAIQPVIGRTLLPHLGGSPLAWKACLVFFQATLLAGYVYAGLLHRFRGVRWQPWLQLALLTAALVLLFADVLGERLLRDLAPRLTALDTSPVLGTLALLVVVIGLPYLLLAAVGPLLQRWFAHLDHPRASDPYFLFVAGNLGGLTALVLYPLLVEPNSVLHGQWLSWQLALGALGVLLFLAAFLVWRSPRNLELEPSEDPNAPAVPVLVGRGPATWPRRLYWLAASGLPVALMMATTDDLTLDVAPAPLLWAVPLAIYLFSFCQAFARLTPYRRERAVARMALFALYAALVIVLAVPLLVALFEGPQGDVIAMRLAVFFFASLLLMPSAWLPVAQPLAVLGIVFVQANVFRPTGLNLGGLLLVLAGYYFSVRLCLERLAEDRPAATALTSYYTWIGVGGLLAGLVQLFVIPLLFRWGYLEFAFFAALAGAFRPAWLRHGFIDWLALQVFRRRRDFDSGQEGPPDRTRVARVFDLLAPVAVGLVLGGLLALRKDRPVAGGPLVVQLLGDWPLLVALGFVACGMARPLRHGLALAFLVWMSWIGQPREAEVVLERTPFGMVRVLESEIPESRQGEVQVPRLVQRTLMHGTTHHGSCIVDPPEWRRYPTTYYHRMGPIGHIMARLESFQPRLRDEAFFAAPFQIDADFWLNHNRDNTREDVRVVASLVGLGPTMPLAAVWSEPPIALVGLGAGVLFHYAHPTQWVDAYELDPAIIALSEGDAPVFPCVKSARDRGVQAHLIAGDARRSLRRSARDGFYRVLIVDAFNSDAIPIHLLTEEAIALYFQKLTPDGVLCIHTSNRYLDLPKALNAIAEQHGLSMAILEPQNEGGEKLPAFFTSQWVVVARDLGTFQKWTANFVGKNELPPFQGRALTPAGRWTDERASLLPVMREEQVWGRMLHGMLVLLLVLGLLMGGVEMIAAMQSIIRPKR